MIDLRNYDSVGQKLTRYGEPQERTSLYHGIPIEYFDEVRELIRTARSVYGTSQDRGRKIRYQFRGPRKNDRRSNDSNFSWGVKHARNPTV